MGIHIKNAHILGSPAGERTDVFISGTRIDSIGRMPLDFTADETIDADGKTLMPGLVNCHTHAYMSLMRNFADDLPFNEWLFERILPIEDALTARDAYYGTMLSIIEMIRTGTTSFVDMHMFPEVVVKACADSGMRALISRGIVGEDRADEAAVTRLKQAFDEMEYAKSLKANVEFAIAPHAIYTCGEDLLRHVAETAKEKKMPLNIHLSETEHEYKTCMEQHGMTPAAYIESLGLLDGHAILAHCVYLDEGDFEILKKPGVYAVTNPASNMKLANGFAPVRRMLDEGINVAIGTDGAASNNSLNMFAEMRLLSMSQKGAARDAVAVTAGETVRMATLGGARAIGRDDLGSVESGKTADLILIDERAANMRPLYNMTAALVYSASGYEVTDVIIGGKIVMKDRNLTTIDEEKVLAEVDAIASRFI